MAQQIIKYDQVTTADLAAARGEFCSLPNPETETSANPRGPHLVERDLPNQNLRAEFASDVPGARRRTWDTSPPAILDTANKNQSTLEPTAPLFNEAEIADFCARWRDVLAGFIDDPHRAVQKADQLVASVMRRFADGVAKERASLEKQWDSGDNVSTEDLRIALQRYRAFFGRLLNAA